MSPRTLIWCWHINEPGIVHFPNDVPSCPVCDAELYTGDTAHTEMYVVTKPKPNDRPPISL